ncbi:MAG: aromatic alcohol reductase, partial [Dokdonella sp.]
MNNDTSVDIDNVLVLGAGQLGMAVLRALAPRVKQAKAPLTVLVWPGSITNPNANEELINAELHLLGVKIIPFDLASSGPDLVALFRRFRTV